jgi:hypothetical protein
MEKGCKLDNDFVLNHYSLSLLYALLDWHEECEIKREEVIARNYHASTPICSL